MIAPRNFAASLFLRYRWLNLPGATLLALLQRTPALHVVEVADEMAASSSIGAVLRSSIAVAASLGAMHSLVGATTVDPSPSANPASATVGQSFGVVFSCPNNGGSVASYNIGGNALARTGLPRRFEPEPDLHPERNPDDRRHLSVFDPGHRPRRGTVRYAPILDRGRGQRPRRSAGFHDESGHADGRRRTERELHRRRLRLSHLLLDRTGRRHPGGDLQHPFPHQCAIVGHGQLYRHSPPIPPDRS